MIAAPTERVPLPVQEAVDRLFTSGQEFGTGGNLTAVRALGQEMVAFMYPDWRTMSSPPPALVYVQREGFNKVTISEHSQQPLAVVSFSQWGATEQGCTTACHTYSLTGKRFTTDNKEALEGILRGRMPSSYEAYAEWMRKSTSDMAHGHPERDFFSTFGFCFDQAWPLFEKHAFSSPMKRAITRVRHRRALAGRDPLAVLGGTQYSN